MVRPRLIFVLLYADGKFVVSRNFRLQKVGDINWLNTHYNFPRIAHSLDELIILNVKQNSCSIEEFCQVVRRITEKVYLPVTAGGGISSVADARRLLRNGADKVSLNSALYADKRLVPDLVGEFGKQCIVGSIDFRCENGGRRVYIENGQRPLGKDLRETVKYVQELGVGEILIRSMDQDGTGMGLALDCSDDWAGASVPIVLGGGAGRPEHFLEGFGARKVEGVACANLFYFIGEALPRIRMYLIENGVSLPLFAVAQL